MTNTRNDANEVAFLEQQLEFLARDRKVDIEYLGLQAMQFVDPNMSMSPGHQTFAYWEEDVSGEMAEWISDNGDDINFSDVKSTKVTASVHTAAHGFRFNQQELKGEAVANMGLIERRREAARQAVMRQADYIAAFGDAEKGLKGFCNHSSVEVLSAAAAAGGAAAPQWDGADKTPMEILKDLFTLCDRIESQTKGNHKCNTILLPYSHHALISRQPLDSGGTNSDSILAAFQKNRPGVSVLAWHGRLDNADAAGTGQRAIAYERNRLNMEFLISDPMAESEVLRRGHFTYEVALTMSHGGILLYKPMSVCYMDSI